MSSPGLPKTYQLGGIRLFELPAEGELIQSDRAAAAVISAAWEHKSRFVVLPAERLGSDFFRLKTRIAGEVIQKFVTYKMRVAIVGDIAKHVAESDALRDFVYESNRGDQVWFVANLSELEHRLESGGNQNPK